jgi:hypothetical protein
LVISLGLVRRQSRSPAADEIHQGTVVLYLAVIGSEWAMFLYIRLGELIPGAARLRDLVGGRWSNLKDVLRDIAIAVAFWIVFTAVAVFMNFALGPSHVESLWFLNPRVVVEIILWVLMSITAGFCEELVYRGCLQKQFLAWTGSAVLAVLAQGILFGIGHWYQGIKMVIVITVLGILFGILARSRDSLRPGMIAHAWGDICEPGCHLLPLKHEAYIR